MRVTDWHVDPDDLAEYAAGHSGPARLASVEAHLTRCTACRAALAAHVPAPAALWDAIADRVDTGPRTLRRHPRIAMVSVSSPPLALVTGLLAAALIGLVAVARVGSAPFATATLVALGPLVPLAGARVAFGRRVDPAGAMAAAAPLAVGKVGGARALAATLVACAAGVVVTPLTTISWGGAAVWLLPALAISAVSVAVGTFVDATATTVGLALAWAAAVVTWLSEAPRALQGLSTDGLVSDRPEVQVALAAVTVAGLLLSVARADATPAWRSAA